MPLYVSLSCYIFVPICLFLAFWRKYLRASPVIAFHSYHVMQVIIIVSSGIRPVSGRQESLFIHRLSFRPSLLLLRRYISPVFTPLLGLHA
jgi:hypothetical protein